MSSNRTGTSDQGVERLGCQTGRDLDVHDNVLRKWMPELAVDPSDVFPGRGQLKPEQLEIHRLQCEAVKRNAERDILKESAAIFTREATSSSPSSRSTGASGRRVRLYRALLQSGSQVGAR